MALSQEQRDYGDTSLAWMIDSYGRAIRACVDLDCCTPAITLMYVLIDNMASLFRTDLSRDTNRCDFIAWVDRYLLPGSGLPCSARDLYAARCGVVHAHSSQSALWRSGQAREILYAWGSGTTEELNAMIRAVNEGQRPPGQWPLAVHVSTLSAAVSQALERAVCELQSDTVLLDRVREAALKIFSPMPQEQVSDLLTRMKRNREHDG